MKKKPITNENGMLKKLEKRNIPDSQLKKVLSDAKFRKNTTLIISAIFFAVLILYALLWCNNMVCRKVIFTLSILIFIFIVMKQDKIYNIFLGSKLGNLSSNLVDEYLEDDYLEVIPLFKYDIYHIDYIKDFKKRAKFFAIISNNEVFIRIKYNDEDNYLNFETLDKLDFLDNYEFKDSIK